MAGADEINILGGDQKKIDVSLKQGCDLIEIGLAQLIESDRAESRIANVR